LDRTTSDEKILCRVKGQEGVRCYKKYPTSSTLYMYILTKNLSCIYMLPKYVKYIRKQSGNASVLTTTATTERTEGCVVL
jgi:hypothetical protein